MPKRRWPTRPPRRPPHVGTIGEVIRHRDEVEIYCLRHGCHHHAPVDLKVLRAEYGDDYTVSGFIARSCCSKCGARYPEIGITVTPIANRRHRMGYVPMPDGARPPDPDQKQ